MSVIKKIVLSSFFVVQSCMSQEITSTLHHEEEIYPLDEFNTIFLMPCTDDDIFTLEDQTNTHSEIDQSLTVVDTINSPQLPAIYDFQQNNHDLISVQDDEEIVPVPHELINSVKKANKKKKKLEKKARKIFFKINKSKD